MNHRFKHINPISFDSGKPGHHLLIIAGVHGDEYEPIMAVGKLIELLENDIKLLSGKITLVPIVNLPAFVNNSRTAEDQLDLARTCPGIADGSISQSIAFEISSLIQTVDFLIDMHTGGVLFEISAMAGYVLHPQAEVLEHQRNMARVFNLPIVWGTSPNLEGRTLSVARDANVPAIYTEYGGGGSCKHSIVEELVEGCCHVMAYLDQMGMVSNLEDRVVYTVEDFRDQSGHLQIMHPAKIDGIFLSAIDLDDQVEEGDILGHVHHIDGHREAVRAVESGVVFLLRKQANVVKGDALAGILPILEKGKRMIYE
ncbi:succinylglutamate desuccinylase/aspartoacylase family protein [Membranihabitans marinus]|uniref:succinylglutamate desuccinylase/aspartoacylase family protein n=1 Tax=Membranihabitans marinus TaxID=1227546 RepID=UPI001F48CFA1|nr:M14 family metallopeptidase [Membranihabitans marinus]